MAQALPASIANALRYGPQTQQSIRRSEYLSDALRTIGAEGGKNIQSGGELAAKLLATAILQRGANKAQDASVQALAADRKAQAAGLLAALRPQQVEEPQMAPQPQPRFEAPAPQQPTPMAPLPTAQAAPAAGIDPSLDAIVRTVFGEARSEAPEGQAAVASVILNRANRAGKSPLDVVFEKGQFEPWGNPKTRAELTALSPQSPEYQAVLRNIAPALQGQDITGGADHFYSPTTQAKLGRPPPAWDNGTGRDLGRHRFFALGYGGQGAHRRDIQAPEPLTAPPQAGGQGDMAPFQVAANGPLTPQMTPSAPAGPSAGAGTGALPQTPQASGGAPTYWKPNAEQMGLVEQLLANPQTYDQGVAMAQQFRVKMTEPIGYKIQDINGMPFYVPEVPGQGGGPQPIALPQEAMTQTMTAQAAGLPTAPQGAYVQRDPLGNVKEAPFAPPAGYNAGPGGYAPIAGGPADPTRVQAPSQGYAYAGGGMQAPIQGGPADPRSPANYIDQVQKFQTQIRPVVDQAIQLKRNVDAIRTGFQQQNGPGDIAMINGLQKLIDEGVVREGDVALQLKGQGIAGGISGLQGYLTSSGFFADPKIRTAILNTGNALYGSLNSTYKDRVLGYKSMADRLLGDGAFEDVFPSSTAEALGWSQAAPPAPNPDLVDKSGRAPGWSKSLTPQQQEMAKSFAPGSPAGSAQNPYVVRTPDEARKLPPGSKILLPDGRIGEVPR